MGRRPSSSSWSEAISARSRCSTRLARALAAVQQGDAVRLVQMGAHKLTIDRRAGGSAGRRHRACPADQRRRRPLRGHQRHPGGPRRRVHVGDHRRARRRLQRLRAQVHIRPAGQGCGGWRAGRHPVYECDGTPTDCVRVGLLGGLAVGADLVVSGINHGANVADDVVYSGTVGAALEAAVLGTSALCLSQQSRPPSLRESPPASGFDFGLAARHGARLAAAIARARPGELFVLSVNYPASPGSASAGSASPGSASPGQPARPARGQPVSGRRAHPAGPAGLPAGPAQGLG